MWLRLFTVFLIGLLAPSFLCAQEKTARNVRNAVFLALEDVQQKNDVPEFLKPMVNLELSFIKRVCDPSDEQMEAIVKEAENVLGKMSDLVRAPGRVAMGLAVGGARGLAVGGDMGVVFRGPNQEQLIGNPYHRVREEMADCVKPKLTAEQYDRYVEESKQRDEFEREVAVSIAVELLDSKLVLTSEQRTQLTEKLMQGWKQVDFQWLQSYQNNPQYLPTMPSDLIEPILTSTQKNLWNAVNRTRVTLHVYVGNANSFGLEEEWIK